MYFVCCCPSPLVCKIHRGSVVATCSRKQTHSGQCRWWSAVYYTGGPKAESPLSQGPQPVFVKTLYTLSVCAQTHLSKFPETSLNKGNESYNKSYPVIPMPSALVVNSAQLSIGLWSYPNKHNRMYGSIWLHR